MPGSTGNTHQTPGEMVGGPERLHWEHIRHQVRGVVDLRLHWEHIRHQVRGVVDLRLHWEHIGNTSDTR